MEQDNRIRFPSAEIDFENDVGLTGQTHDLFPSPGQARYDWMRMYVIGLLANQSSDEEPYNFRHGTIWFSFQTDSYKYYDGEMFSNISNAIEIQGTSLTDWSEKSQEIIKKVTPRSVFSGEAEENFVTEVDIPDSVLFTAANKYAHPIAYITEVGDTGGKLIDPRLTKFNNGRTKVVFINSDTVGDARLLKGQKYTIIMERIDFIEPNTVIAT